MSVKVNGSKVKDAVAFIQSVWQKEFPDHSFEYEFLDDHFAEVYRADKQVSNIVGILGCIGNHYFLPWFIWPCFLFC